MGLLIRGKSYQFGAISTLFLTLNIDVFHNDMIVFTADTIKFRQSRESPIFDRGLKSLIRSIGTEQPKTVKTLKK